jgi:hypothetical protein
MAATGAGLVAWGGLDTGPGEDLITGIGSLGIDEAGGTMATGLGHDRVDARAGGFAGPAKPDLGDGNDNLVGFSADSTVRPSTGKFIGGSGRNKLLLDDGVYRIEDGLIALASRGNFMRTSGFEKIGGVHGGLFNLADGTLTITGGVAPSLV